MDVIKVGEGEVGVQSAVVRLLCSLEREGEA